MKLQPLGDKVVVEAQDAAETTSGGIVLPDAAQDKPQQGKVVAVGPGRILDSGERAEMAVKVGDTVVYSKYGGTEIKLDGEEYLILDQDSIYFIRG